MSGTSKSKKTDQICPVCKKNVPDYAPDHGGTVYDGNQRYHADCYYKMLNDLADKGEL